MNRRQLRAKTRSLFAAGVGLAGLWVGMQPSAMAQVTPAGTPPKVWAFQETFEGAPTGPSQALLPKRFDYVVTHRTVPGEQFTKAYTPFHAEHDSHCGGPNPAATPVPRHLVHTRQDSNGTNLDKSFFICNNHMMTALGEVDGYTVSAFWPRQEFDFSKGGTLEWDVNVNLSISNREASKYWVRSWWEVMIVPRDQLKVAAAPPSPEAPIDETYPLKHIVLDFRMMTRRIRVGNGALAPNGWIQVPAHGRDMTPYHENWWHHEYPNDPALNDPRIRRKMRAKFEQNRVIWSIEKADGTLDDFSVDVPGGLPFSKGLVVFKTHAYTPMKEGNFDHYTFHWDNIRFDGPVVGRYDSYEADQVVYLQHNGNRPIGDTQTVNINLPRTGANPVLFGQVNQPIRGQVLVSINGSPNIPVHPYSYSRQDCMSDFWKSFRLPLPLSLLKRGNNTIKWTVGPRNPCVNSITDRPNIWDGFSIKSLEIQMDRRQ